ncbi:MAG: hypothetical protein JNM76_04475 [Betaproteobacteria bacterium]|nr:hypothetical protein [Betaproteobacteria bacterium]
MRALILAVVFVVTLVLTAVAAFVLVMVLAGPHGGLLPRAFEPIVFIVGWVAVLAIPTATTVWAWRRMGNRNPAES